MAWLVQVFAINSIIFAVAVSIWRWRRIPVITPSFGFLMTSILFINTGFTWLYVQNRAEPWAVDALVSVSTGLLCATLGTFIGMLVCRVRRRELVQRPGDVRLDLSYYAAIFVATFVFATTVLYFLLLGYVPLIEGIAMLIREGYTPGLTNTPRIMRDVYVNPTAQYVPFQGLLEAMRYFGLPIVSVWFVHYWRIGLHPRLSVFMVLVSGILIILTGQRWPLMYMLATLLTYWSRTQIGQRKFSGIARRFLLIGFVMGVGLSALLGRTDDGSLSYVDMFITGARDLLQRIVLGNATVPFLSYEIFPSREGWLYGWSWIQDLLAYLPGPMPSYPVTFYQTVTGDTRGFTAPPDFYTEAYINGGYLVVWMASILWGLILASMDRVLVRYNRTLLGMSMSSMLATLLTFTSLTGIVFVIGGIVVMAFIWFMSKLVMRLLRRADFIRTTGSVVRYPMCRQL